MTDRTTVEASVRAAIEALAGQLPAEWSAESGELILERIGDALRLGLEIPAELRGWLRNRLPGELSEVTSQVQDRLGSLSLPGKDDDALQSLVEKRDRAESIATAAIRHCIDQQLAPAQQDWCSAFLSSLELLDGRLSKRVSRYEVEDALGARAWLASEGSWTNRLSNREAAAPHEADTAGRPALADNLPLAGHRPPDQAVASYLEHGDQRIWVEGCAARNPELAQDLASLVEMMRNAGDPVSFVARLWEHNTVRGESGPVSLEAPQRLAAAGEDAGATEPVVIALGVLPPLEAEAWLELHDGKLELRVTADDPQSIRRVRLDEVEGALDRSSGVWMAQKTSIPDGPARLRIEGPDGSFDETFELV